eukprot:gnl/Dysnectes_brevis/10188_a19829_155.p1 GENE.gnl/Dysnectes_brevis/10188_a19829_155~~gnl/Dysnectes_brevis/10188_a19829_155.p1  ORF type:complete len:714 (-),score=161.15 gnl/Dysnectes_brevis/10188_a19829_155:59-2200(-)
MFFRHPGAKPSSMISQGASQTTRSKSGGSRQSSSKENPKASQFESLRRTAVRILAAQHQKEGDMDKLRSSLNQSETNNQRLLELVRRLNCDKARLAVEAKSQAERVAQLGAESETSKQLITGLGTQLRQLTGFVDRAEKTRLYVSQGQSAVGDAAQRLDEGVRDLAERASLLGEQLMQEGEQRQALTGQMELMEAALTARTSRVGDLERELRDTSAKLLDTSAKLQAEESTSKSAREEATRLQCELRDASSKLNDTSSKLQRAEGAVEQLRSRISDYDREIDQKDRELVQVRQSEETSRNLVRKHESECVSLRSSLDKARAQKDQFGETIRDLRSELKDTSSKLGDTSSKLKDTCAKLSSERENLALCNAKSSSLIEDLRSRIVGLTSELSQIPVLQSSIADLTADRDSWATKSREAHLVITASAEQARLASDREQVLNDSLLASNASVSQLQAQAAETAQRCTVLASELDRARVEVDGLKETVKSRDDQLEALRTSTEEAAAKAAETAAKAAADASAEVASLSSRITSLETALHAAQSRADSLAASLSSCELAASQERAAAAELRTEFEAKTSELSMRSLELADSERTVSLLREQLEAARLQVRPATPNMWVPGGSSTKRSSGRTPSSRSQQHMSQPRRKRKCPDQESSSTTLLESPAPARMMAAVTPRTVRVKRARGSLGRRGQLRRARSSRRKEVTKDDIFESDMFSFAE